MDAKEIDLDLENKVIVKAYRNLLKSIRRSLSKEDKKKIREIVHNHICSQIVFPDKSEKYKINEDYINQSNITLSDYGAYCSEDEHYDTEFGTRYYRAPEIMLG
jgi:serine/threonine protein kinase